MLSQKKKFVHHDKLALYVAFSRVDLVLCGEVHLHPTHPPGYGPDYLFQVVIVHFLKNNYIKTHQSNSSFIVYGVYNYVKVHAHFKR